MNNIPEEFSVIHPPPQLADLRYLRHNTGYEEPLKNTKCFKLVGQQLCMCVHMCVCMCVWYAHRHVENLPKGIHCACRPALYH